MDTNKLRERVKKLVDLAQASDLNGRYEFVHADFDEIKTLVSLAPNEFPPTFHDILRQSKFPDRITAKNEFGQRLSRSIEVSETFGVAEPLISENDVTPIFSLQNKEKARVLELCVDIRKIIFASTFFDEPHKRRLLNRIAAIEHEVHQKKGKLDVLLAGVSDVGDALGNFGKQVEPLTKRMKEIANLGRKGSSEYDQLPSPDEIPALPPPNETEE